MPQQYNPGNVQPYNPVQPPVTYNVLNRPLTEKDLPEELKPIGPWGYFGFNILFSLPLIGVILLFVFALGGTSKVNLRNYARSFFCNLIIVIILLIILSATGTLTYLLSALQNS